MSITEYPWVKEQVFTVCAEYGEKDRGSFFKDDFPDERWSVRPGAEAASYRVIGLENDSFSSPEEVILRLTALAPGGFALDLQMCDQEAAKYICAWRAMQKG